jgi:glycosyltransferase involved in cell wall biosynthesis
LLRIARRTPEVEFRVGGMLRIGGNGSVREVVRDLSALPNVRIVGYLRRGEIVPFLGNATALLNTSHYEGFSNTFLEAWLSGTPVVTSSRDPDDIIARNKLGTVADNYEEVPGVLRSLVTHPGYDVLAERCRAYVLENHNERVIAERFVASLPPLAMRPSLRRVLK